MNPSMKSHFWPGKMVKKGAMKNEDLIIMQVVCFRLTQDNLKA